jgi:hypothetical protein
MRRVTIPTGTFTVNPFESIASRMPRFNAYDAVVTIAGLGGTGAFLAEDLARLFSVHLGWRVRFILSSQLFGIGSLQFQTY